MKKVRLIKQRDEDDCGIACLVMLSFGQSNYQKARVAPGKSAKDDCFLTSNRQMKKGLDGLGIKRGNKFIGLKTKSWQRVIPQTGVYLVGCGLRKGNSKKETYWHWVVYDGRVGKVFDPHKSRPKPFVPDGRYKKPFRLLEIFP